MPLRHPPASAWHLHGERALQGDGHALGALLDAHRPLLMALANRSLPSIVASKVGASDLVQKTFEDAVAGFPQLRARDPAQFWSWLSALMAKNVVDVERKLIVSQKRSVRREELDRSALSDQHLPRDHSPESVLLMNESFDRLSKALHLLPAAHQSVLNWHFLEGRTFAEIGRLVDRSEDAVRMLATRALERLRRELSSDDSTA